MRTVQLSPALRVEPDGQHAERSDETAIESEIAARLVELAEITSKSRASEFLYKLVAIHTSYHPALWLFLRIASGDLGELTRSYTEQGKAAAKAKQAVQQEMERSLAAIENNYPEAARAIIQLRRITAQYHK